MAQDSLIVKRTRRRHHLMPLVEQRQRIADSLVRTLTQLGLERRQKPSVDLNQYLAQRARSPVPAPDSKPTEGVHHVDDNRPRVRPRRPRGPVRPPSGSWARSRPWRRPFAPTRGPPARARRRHGSPGGPGRGRHAPGDPRRVDPRDGAGRARGAPGSAMGAPPAALARRLCLDGRRARHPVPRARGLHVATWWTGPEAQARRIAAERRLTMREVWRLPRMQQEARQAGLDVEALDRRAPRQGARGPGQGLAAGGVRPVVGPEDPGHLELERELARVVRIGLGLRLVIE